MTEPLDALDLSDGTRLAIVAVDGGRSAVPMIRDQDGRWRRAVAGDGAADALVGMLANGSRRRGAFAVRSYTADGATGERAIGVDQTNESVIVGDAAVVKWATHLQDGPHPAPRRIGLLREAGFGGMPTPWGVVTWQPPDGVETMVAYVDEYLPGAVDGWTWAVEMITEAALRRQPGPVVAAAASVGTVVAELHAALSGTRTLASTADAQRWRSEAMASLEIACLAGDSDASRCARARRRDIEGLLDGLGDLVGTPVVEGHGDLHVGQVLRADGRFVVTDFDGNPVLPAAQRALPIPAALDLAGMTQSLTHAAIVAARYTPLDPVALAEVDAAARAALLDSYARRLDVLGHAELYDPKPLPALRVQQVLREIAYATRHLPRWMYVPDAALPALLDEGTPP